MLAKNIVHDYLFPAPINGKKLAVKATKKARDKIMPLNKKYVFDLAKKKTVNIKTNKIPNSTRYDVINSLIGNNNTGIELGVAKGGFSSKMIQSEKFSLFFGVDMYEGSHNIDEYKEALEKVGLESCYKLLRMKFSDAESLFPDNYFDFIYVDGFAHTGEDGGSTLYNWYRKLKVGGVMAGDDYHDDWPLVIWAVNDFCSKIGAELNQTDIVEDTLYNQYPSWFFTKKQDHNKIFTQDPELAMISEREKSRIDTIRGNGSKVLWAFHKIGKRISRITRK